ncbi:MAG: GNAT family N-acetyltransferase [Pseudomonadota bacterium]
MQDDAANLTIGSCEQIELADLHAGFCRTFSDYSVAMQPTIGEFSLMLTQRGFDKTLSWAALCGRSVVSFWLAGTNQVSQGTNAYVIATGTAPDFRGRGLAAQLHHCMRQQLAGTGVQTVQLEVIADNIPARSLYTKLGFQPVRELACFDIAPTAVSPVAIGNVRLAACTLADVLRVAQACRDWQASWQNDDMALARIPAELMCIAAQENGEPVAYGILIRPTGTIAQLAVRPDKRRTGIGSTVLHAFASIATTHTLRVINADSRDVGFQAFLVHHGARPDIEQVEMILVQ